MQQLEIDIRDVAYYAEIAAHHNWDTAARAAMRDLANSGRPFTADDFRRLMADVPTPHHPNTIGSFFRTCKAEGLITTTENGRRSTAPSRRGALIHEWVGVPKNTIPSGSHAA